MGCSGSSVYVKEGKPDNQDNQVSNIMKENRKAQKIKIKIKKNQRFIHLILLKKRNQYIDIMMKFTKSMIFKEKKDKNLKIMIIYQSKLY